MLLGKNAICSMRKFRRSPPSELCFAFFTLGSGFDAPLSVSQPAFVVSASDPGSVTSEAKRWRKVPTQMPVHGSTAVSPRTITSRITAIRTPFRPIRQETTPTRSPYRTGAWLHSLPRHCKCRTMRQAKIPLCVQAFSARQARRISRLCRAQTTQAMFVCQTLRCRLP